ncbi:hypothetical protein EVAR_2360_1 [Eumeta japonica]|uniref:Uncharacterized protein n=1 Tax=Eumeta variegata TaxID=151549 RepID=A0A4C1SG58_EUMVA|nr:hypothetical protein EVAR_2360_1 [Eumeta japonica]
MSCVVLASTTRDLDMHQPRTKPVTLRFGDGAWTTGPPPLSNATAACMQTSRDARTRADLRLRSQKLRIARESSYRAKATSRRRPGDTHSGTSRVVR